MLPRVILHNAVSADGRVDHFAADVELFYRLVARWKENATLCGSDTLLRAAEAIPPERPEDLRPPKVEQNDPRPLLVVPDTRGRIRTWHHWRKQPYWRDVLVLCAERTPRDYLKYLEERHLRHLIAGRERVDYRKALEELAGQFGVTTVRVDSGGTLNGVLLRAGLVSEISLLIHPAFVGGTSSRSMYRAPDLASAAGVVGAKLAHVERLANDVVWLVYELAK